MYKKEDKYILIFGLGSNGRSAVRFFSKKNKKIIACDENIKIRNNFKKDNPKIKTLILSKINWNEIQSVIVSPGIDIKHPGIKIAYKFNIPIYRDLDIFIKNIDQKKIIAVTGTNGKSTTVSIIGSMVLKKKKKIFIGGNLGPSLFSALSNNKYEKYIIELSSYQLETAKNFKPKISVLLNISEDHIDRYKDIKNYAQVKKNIFNKINHSQYAIISIDDKWSKNIYNDIKKRCQNVIPISTVKNSKGVVSLLDDKIIDNYFDQNLINLSTKNLKINFEQNKQNILASYVVSKILNYKTNLFLKSLVEFQGLKHRSELVYKNKKMMIINDSKATNLSATINTVKSYKNVYLIMGGKLKHNDFSSFLKLKGRIKKIYLIGDSMNFIFNKLNLVFKCEKSKFMKKAIRKSIDEVKNNKQFSTILLAPACSSFDQYKNFEDRGNDFKRIVKNFLINK